MVACGIDEHSSILPASTLQTHVLIDRAQALQLPVANGQCWEYKQSFQYTYAHSDTGTAMDVKGMSGGMVQSPKKTAKQYSMQVQALYCGSLLYLLYSSILQAK